MFYNIMYSGYEKIEDLTFSQLPGSTFYTYNFSYKKSRRHNAHTFYVSVKMAEMIGFEPISPNAITDRVCFGRP